MSKPLSIWLLFLLCLCTQAGTAQIFPHSLIIEQIEGDTTCMPHFGNDAEHTSCSHVEAYVIREKCELNFFEWKVFNRWGVTLFDSRESKSRTFDVLNLNDGLYWVTMRFQTSSDADTAMVTGSFHHIR